MAVEVVEALDRFRSYLEPRDGIGNNPFKLGCSFERPATEEEIASAWTADIPAEMIDLWSTSRESRLFEDIDYGQWGLVLLSPSACARRTTEERARRPNSYRAGDIVIGEFLGDLELLVLAPSKVGEQRILVALPFDDRPDWYAVGSTMADFLNRYIQAFGGKYWE